MFATLKSSLKIGCVALALAFANSSGAAEDPVRVSFDRMLTHAPAPASAPAGASAAADPLVAALVVPVRDGTRPAGPASATDPVAESFARMFAHEPSRHTPALPESASVDPLIAAVVWPLLRSNQYTVAGGAPAARH